VLCSAASNLSPLPARGAACNVGEEKDDGSGWKIPHDPSLSMLLVVVRVDCRMAASQREGERLSASSSQTHLSTEQVDTSLVLRFTSGDATRVVAA
jgi:hypothetical protein